MNSPHVKELLFRYVDDDLSEELRQQVESHLSACQACRDELAYVTRIQDLLSRRSQASPGLWEGIEDRIRRSEDAPWRVVSARAAQQEGAPNIWGQFEWVGKRLVPLFAVAAAVLVAVFGSLNSGDVRVTVEDYLEAQWDSESLEGVALSGAQLSRNDVFILATSTAEDASQAR